MTQPTHASGSTSHQLAREPSGAPLRDPGDRPAQILGPDGVLAGAPGWVTPGLTRDLYRWMRLTRRLDAEAFALQRHGELGIWAQSLGQEAAQVGSVTALRPADYVFPSYREHAACLVRGVSPSQILAQWRGVSGCGWDPAARHLHAYTVVLGAHLPHATGYAMGVQRDGTDEVVTAYFGDGASSQGDANEAFNWAATCSAPVLFFCQNNQYAISTPASLQMRTPIHHRAAGFGLRSFLVDGNDVLAVHEVTREAVRHIRSGGGPAFVEAVTYRMGAHTSSDDPTRYRDQAESDAWQAKDPLSRVEKLLEAQGWWDQGFRTALDAECEALAVEVRSAVRGFGPVELDGLFDQVYARRTALLSSEKAAYADLVAGFLDEEVDDDGGPPDSLAGQARTARAFGVGVGR
ncbi:thiamine pyrophosphate-dependent dehydrogenase E1 component subunit alpha [Kineosporia sp. J2-2]|uniref:2-oxoisovalerate dehydrogenase subunit alpha n=1 Tax=Kineosporia corallincola TaxID=2835133 RepID=A0ABS5TSF3_9ACTN|nr:thiamine pyrophosphate-dependent dehydrogenase E1 component subunit alpha [Kineosporia corallincola]MBT0773742.1 thiamine pyrophosphate-dependent dehydrogenase E1 component subunit alpha [Kineosporia corallincola]